MVGKLPILLEFEERKLEAALKGGVIAPRDQLKAVPYYAGETTVASFVAVVVPRDASAVASLCPSRRSPQGRN